MVMMLVFHISDIRSNQIYEINLVPDLMEFILLLTFFEFDLIFSTYGFELVFRKYGAVMVTDLKNTVEVIGSYTHLIICVKSWPLVKVKLKDKYTRIKQLVNINSFHDHFLKTF